MLDITVCVVRGLTVVTLEGSLVRGETDRLVEIIEWLQEFGERRIMVHAAALDAVDIPGLSALMQCHSALSARGGSLLVSMPSTRLLGALERTGLDRVVPILHEPLATLDAGVLRHA